MDKLVVLAHSTKKSYSLMKKDYEDLQALQTALKLILAF
jgi:hypothetical protein